MNATRSTQWSGKISQFTVAAVAVCLVFTSCRAQDSGLPRIRFGAESCDRCRMIISEKRFAAAYRTESGELRKFDDLGCALLHRVEQQENVSQLWAFDYEETAWLDAGESVFVHSRQLLTPMGYGIAILPTAAKAAALAEKTEGRVVYFDDLQQIVKQ